MKASAETSGLFCFRTSGLLASYGSLAKAKKSGMFPSRPESSGANTLYTTAGLYATLQEIIYFY